MKTKPLIRIFLTLLFLISVVYFSNYNYDNVKNNCIYTDETTSALMKNTWHLVDFGYDDVIPNGKLEPNEIDTLACMKDNTINFTPFHTIEISQGFVLCENIDFYFDTFAEKWQLDGASLQLGNGKNYTIQELNEEHLILVCNEKETSAIYIFQKS
jgi:hypothetical protein